MNAQLTKEARPLLWPWCLAVALALIPEGAGMVPALGLCAVIAALPFGTEFQHQTWHLLLTQPKERHQFWSVKLLLSFAALLSIGLIALTGQLLQANGNEVAVLGWGALLGTACSIGFWMARSHSAVFAVVVSTLSNSALLACVLFASSVWLGPDWLWHAPNRALMLLGVLFLYCGTYVGLGWAFWRRRLVVLSVAATVFLAVFLWAWFGDRENRKVSEFWWAAVFLIPTCCSAGFWTMVARSTIGGAVFTICSQFIVFVIVHLLAELSGILIAHPMTALLLMVLAGEAYCILFLWLGRRKFARLEMAGTANDSAEQLSSGSWIYWPSALRARAATPQTNLWRKEAGLARPLFGLAGLFLVCWFVVLSLQLVFPGRGLEELFVVIAALYMPFIHFMAGSLLVSEEQALGTHSWHLTLPPSARRQWFAKLLVSALLALLLGIGLPAVTGLLTNHFSGLQSIRAFSFWPTRADPVPAGLQFAALLAMLFALGIWATTATGNVVRATLVAFPGAALLGFFAVTGARSASAMEGGLASGLVNQVVASLQLPLNFFERFSAEIAFVVEIGGVSLIAMLLLWQAFTRYRQVQEPNHKLVIRVIVACAATGIVAGAGSGLVAAVWHVPEFEAEITEALIERQHAARQSAPENLALDDFLQEAGLSNPVARWLRGCTIKYEIRASRDNRPRFTELKLQITTKAGRKLLDLVTTTSDPNIMARWGKNLDGGEFRLLVQPPGASRAADESRGEGN